MKSAQTRPRAAKKFAPYAAAPGAPTLPGLAEPAAAFHLTAAATADQLFPITALSDAQLRNISVQERDPAGAPWFPKPARGRYDTRAVLAGLLRRERARAERRADHTTLASMDAFEKTLGISKHLLKEMKNDGCPGFHISGRIDLIEWLHGLEPWLAGKTDNDKYELQAEGVATYGDMKEKYQARNEKLKNSELLGSSMSKAVAIEVARVLQAIHFGGYDRLVEELPGLLAGHDAKTIRRHLTKMLKSLRDSEENEIAELEKQTADQLENQKELAAA